MIHLRKEIRIFVTIIQHVYTGYRRNNGKQA